MKLPAPFLPLSQPVLPQTNYATINRYSRRDGILIISFPDTARKGLPAQGYLRLRRGGFSFSGELVSTQVNLAIRIRRPPFVMRMSEYPLQRFQQCWPGLWAFYPLFLASIVTAYNAVKPVVIDDTAYLLYARHIAQHPLDPYGFSIFWYTWPEPAFEVLAPPVYLYWLACGWKLFGDQIVWLKVGTWPWLILLAYSLRTLLRYLAAPTERWMLTVLMFSPVILPSVNLMLDVPAYALGVAALACWFRANNPSGGIPAWLLAFVTGVLLGLAMQTKYTLLTFLPVLLMARLAHHRWSKTALAVITALAIFLIWEGFCLVRYGNSHFWYHASQQCNSNLWEQFQTKAALTGPLLGYWGYFGAPIGLLIASRLGLPPRVLGGIACLWIVGTLLVSCIPERILLISDTLSLAVLYWQITGGGFGIITVVGMMALWFASPGDAAAKQFSRFLVLWGCVELVGYYLLTPFGAARRLMGWTLVTHLAVARLYSLPLSLPLRHKSIMDRRPTNHTRIAGWVAISLLAGWTIAAIDWLDAQAEKWCVEQASQALEREAQLGSGRIWFTGHWGFQHYALRQGWEHIIPGSSQIRSGDIVVLPIPPHPEGLYRPHVGSIPILLPEGTYQVIAQIIWDDPIIAQTIPNYYGGSVALIGRSHPRLRVVVARLLRDWCP